MDALFAAVDVANMETNISTLLIGFVAINVIFLGYKYLRRTLARG